jgi:NAD(P)-dependent dehydrogenase (short-subunit alcohol dehydrogenase family)
MYWEKTIFRIPVGRLSAAKNIARGAKFLVIEDADFITGSTLSINGGQHMYQEFYLCPILILWKYSTILRSRG